MKFARWPLGFVFAALVLAGCGGGSKPAATAPDPASPSGTSAKTATQAPSATASPSATTSPTATPESADAVTQAAARALEAVPRNPLTRDSCLQDNPEQKICINLVTPESLGTGIARFTAGDPQGGGFAFLMGRTGTGEWHYWMGSQQQFYVLTQLPGELRACGGGKPVALHEAPDASSPGAGELGDGTTIQADAFVLTSAGAFGVGGKRGDGWYRVTSPAGAWVHASDTAAASLGDCSLRDAIEGPTPRG